MPDAGYSWVVLASSTTSLTFFGLFVYSSGLFHVALRDRFHDDHSKTAWAGALFVSNFCLTAPVASLIINWSSCRVGLMTSGVVYALGFLLTAFSTSVDQCIVTLGMIAGFAGGLHIGAAWAVIGYRFRRKLSLACGVAGMGIGLGVFALAPVMQRSLDHFGFTGFFILLAGIGLQNVVLGALYRPSKIERERKRHMKSKVVQNSNRKFENNILKRACLSISNNFLIFHNTKLILFAIGLFLHGFGLTVVYYFLPSFCISLGSSLSETAWVLSTAGLSSLIGRGLLGLAVTSGDLDELTIYFSCLGIFGIATVLFPVMAAYSRYSQLVYAVILGVYSGCINSIMISLIINMVGVIHQTTALGSVNLLYGIGSFLGTISAANIADYMDSFSGTYIIAGAANILSCLVTMLIPLTKPNDTCDRETKIKGAVRVIIIDAPVESRTPTDELHDESTTEALHISNEDHV